MNNMSKKIIGIVGLLISIVLIWYLLKHVNFTEAWKIVTAVPFYYPLLMVGVYLLTFWVRAWRWKMMMLNHSEIKWNILLNSLVIGFAGNNVLPARAGELVRMELFSRRTNINRITILTSIFLEKILDCIILLVLLLISSFILWYKLISNSFVFSTAMVLTGVLLGLIVLLIVIKTRGKKILSFLKKKQSKSYSIAAFSFEKVFEAFSFLRIDKNTATILFVSICIWLLEALVFIIAISSNGSAYNDGNIILMGVIALCIVNFSILIPSSPGYIGVFQAAFLLAFSLFNIDKSESLALAILIHSCQFIPVTIWGGLIFFLTYYSKKQ